MGPVLRVARALVAGHGATDAFEPVGALVAAYGAAAAVPTRAVDALFWLSSIAHLSTDRGWTPSLLGHALLAAARAVGHERAAAAAMLAYMCVEHVPRHLRAARVRHGGRSLVAPALASLALLGAPARWTSVYSVLARRVVVGHALCHGLQPPPVARRCRPRASHPASRL